MKHKVSVMNLALALDVKVSNPAVRGEDGRLIWTRANAIWDTGSQICMISRALCKKLRFEPRIKVNFSGIGGVIKGAHDVVYLSIASDNATFILAMAGVIDSIPGDYDMLIGMDVITQGDFSISTANGYISYSFSPYPGHLKRLRK